MTPEGKVGLFVVAAAIALFVLSTRISTVANFGMDGYRLYAVIADATGLKINSEVSIYGVKAGFLESMKIEKNGVRITLFIDRSFEVSDDSVLFVVQESLLGSKSINILPGSGGALREGATINNVYKNASIEDAIDEIKRFAQKLNSVFDDTAQNQFKNIIANINELSERLLVVSEEFRVVGSTINERLPSIMAQIDDLTREFSQVGSSINDRLPEIMGKFSALEDELRDVIESNKEPLTDTIESMGAFFDKGSDTLESLGGALNKIEQAEMQFDIGYNQLFNDKLSAGYINAAYLPNPINYYMIGVEDTPIINELDNSGNAVVPKLHDDKGKYLISAQLGKRYGSFLVRGGLIRDTGGIGVDYFSKDDRLKLSMEIYDFNAINDIRGDNPHMRFTARYLPWKFITLYGGYDNFLNAKADNFFAGAGVHFVDDDLKYLVISGAGAIK
ncbi:MAG: MlaD family protein [Helicobacteraceae bacterium]|jgi:phospholipid/cholesterol/gamma-HCH transport system substrate-binding protein|nr:MlaD family protein [Helicobacteraceae bacterium]